MKVSLHSGRTCSAKHNDRSFLEEKDEAKTKAESKGKIYIENSDNSHINSDMTALNRVWTAEFGEDTYATFKNRNIKLEDVHKQTYTEIFKDGIDAQNERYKSTGHKERCKTIDDYYKNPQKGISETILQIGSAKEGTSLGTEEVLWRAAQKLRDETMERVNGCKIVSMSLHVDESAPHIHMDAVFVSSRGMPEQSRALKVAGFTRPDMSKPEGRYNNAMMSFTTWQRERFEELVRDYGLNIESSEPCSRAHEIDKTKALINQNNELENDIKTKSETIADLDSSEMIDEKHIAEAVGYRTEIF